MQWELELEPESESESTLLNGSGRLGNGESEGKMW